VSKPLVANKAANPSANLDLEGMTSEEAFGSSNSGA
jgi:hypothetical protein